MVESPGTLIVGALITFGLLIWAGINANKKEQKEKQRISIVDGNSIKLYKEKKIQYNIKENYLTVNYKRGFAPIATIKQYIWIEEEKLCFFPTIALRNSYYNTVNSIPLKDIEYYAIQGNISKETKISGGGGEMGGSSIGGAIIGGVIAGGAGAIIGSRKGGRIEPIKSEIITHDNRETFLNYFVDGVKRPVFFYYTDYPTLLKLIPEKDYNNLFKRNVSKGSKPLFKEQLVDLADLKEKGIITEEEFNEKKKILLDKIK